MDFPVPFRTFRTFRKAVPHSESWGGAKQRCAEAEWLAAFKGGPPSSGNFLNAANCSEAIALAEAAMRYRGRSILPLAAILVIGLREPFPW